MAQNLPGKCEVLSLISGTKNNNNKGKKIHLKSEKDYKWFRLCRASLSSEYSMADVLIL